MPHERDRDRKVERKAPRPDKARPEFEVAYYTKELGRPLQRKMLERQLAGLGGEVSHAANHHDDAEASPQLGDAPPPEDRAG
jgi:hypothetical protein